MDEPVATTEAVTPGAPDALALEAAGGRRRRAGVVLKLLALALVAGLLALLGWATLAAGEGTSLVARVAAGEKPPAPAFELDVLWPHSETWPRASRAAVADGRLSLDELRGTPVVLNFWASWCVPCRDEAPILNASARAHRGEVAFVGIDVQDLRGDALAFLREFDVPYVSVRDRADEAYRTYGLTGVPETYYLDPAGRIVEHTPGAIAAESLEAGIAAAMEGGANTR